ncbi:hypothetical protein AMECASPLE_005934 [Ameca splendens]|uniref:Uncharacterized protein n=1 Tax=Ameca splendens TaxID=208324 RepID=A0ABV0XCB4_9TELE
MVQPFNLEDGQLMTFGADGAVQVWDLESINTANISSTSSMFEMEPINELVVGHNVWLSSVARSSLPDSFIWFVQDSNGAIWKLDLSFTNTMSTLQHPSIHWSIHPSVCPSIHPFIHLSIRPSIRPLTDSTFEIRFPFVGPCFAEYWTICTLLDATRPSGVFGHFVSQDSPLLQIPAGTAADMMGRPKSDVIGHYIGWWPL